MKLEYNILWLDDNIEGFVDYEYVAEIEKHLVENGFKPNIRTFDKSEDFFELLNSSFDLILTDYHLSEEINGRQVVDMIRGSEFSVLTEILFYTAKADLGEEQHRIERVSFLETNAGTDAHYRKVTSKTIELIDLTIKKFQNIVAMRGMIMHETSSLDLIMDQLVSNYINNPANSANKDVILPPIILAIQKNAKEKCDKAFSNKTNKILKDNVLFSASQKIFALGEILKLLDQEDFSKDYNNEINWYRNQFAHAEIFVNDEGKQHFKIRVDGQDDELIFNEELCKTIRQNIIKHKENLEKLKKTIK
jgi:CheY-like chemotaxis protein